jgi:hypothetical protein
MPSLIEALPAEPGTPLQVLVQRTHSSGETILKGLEVLERIGVVTSSGWGKKKLFWRRPI